jgi:hypothetical protein
LWVKKRERDYSSSRYLNGKKTINEKYRRKMFIIRLGDVFEVEIPINTMQRVLKDK